VTAYTIVIPARYASTRLPAKPLADIAGKSMLQRVWERASGASAQRVIIATDDERILAHARAFGAECVATRVDHPSGTDRLHEVSEQLRWRDDEIVVNVQGDEPLIPPAVIDQVAAALAADAGVTAATLAEQIDDIERLFDPNVVKVVRDADARALYFSRAPIPWARDAFAAGRPGELPAGQGWLRHIGIYAYRVAALRRYVAWPRHPLEVLESLEQLRLLGMGERMRVDVACAEVPGGIDTAADLERVRALFTAGATGGAK
jgi:3-deoxy-manno-octulosonate cytidylyltransferase (CMP-KDO synthetase)